MKDLLKKIDNIKALIDNNRPLTNFMKQQLNNYYKIQTTYSSNAIEGNSLTITETKIVIEDGITVAGKPLKDYFEAIGHSYAYEHILYLAQNKNYFFSELDLFQLHSLFYRNIDFNNAGVYRNDNVIITGANFIPPRYHKLPVLMHDFIIDLNNKKIELHPVELSAYAHLKLVAIHPFIDGNGRISRLLMNLILLNNGYQIISILPEDRDKYIDSLKIALNPDNQDYSHFFRFIAENELKAQYEYCRLVDINL